MVKINVFYLVNIKNIFYVSNVKQPKLGEEIFDENVGKISIFINKIEKK